MNFDVFLTALPALVRVSGAISGTSSAISSLTLFLGTSFTGSSAFLFFGDAGFRVLRVVFDAVKIFMSIFVEFRLLNS
jgi:hypothetical protein